MVLYYAHTIYHVLECVLHKLKYNNKEMAVLVYPEYLTTRGVFEDNIYYFFVEAYKCNPFKFSSWSSNDIKMMGDQIYLNNFGRNLNDYKEIYIAGAHFSFGAYVAVCDIPFNYLEDACYSWWWREDFANIMKNNNFAQYNLLSTLGILDGETTCIKNFYVNVPKGKKYDDSRVVSFNVLDELRKLSSDDFNAVVNIFSPNEEVPIVTSEKAILLLTDSASRYLVFSMKRQKHFFALVMDYFASNFDGSLYIKPHPEDLCDYSDTFPKANLLPSGMPIELFMAINDISKFLAITVQSAGGRMFPNLMYLDVGTYKHVFFMEKVHVYYGVKAIYEELKHNYTCFQISCIPKVLSCFSVEAEDDISKISCTENSILLFVSENTEITILQDFLLKSGTVLVFDHVPDYVKELLDIPAMHIIVKAISVTNFETDEIHKDYIYIFSMDNIVLDKIKAISYKKELRYSREVAIMERYDEQQMETVALRAVLEATEKRLREVLEENDALKAELAETQAKA